MGAGGGGQSTLAGGLRGAYAGLSPPPAAAVAAFAARAAAFTASP